MGLDPLANTLEELWISYNNIEKMKGILGMRKLKVLYMSHNRIDSWAEVQKLAEMESLVELDLVGRLIFIFPSVHFIVVNIIVLNYGIINNFFFF